MKHLLRTIVATVSIIAAAASEPAYAVFGIGDIVIGPTNLIQNTASALAAVRNEVNTASIYIKQIEATIALARSLESAKDLSTLAGVQQELQLYQQLKNTNTQLQSVMQRSLDLSRNVTAQWASSNMTWKQFLAAKSAVDSSNSNALSAQYATVTDSIEKIAARRKAIVDQLQNATGQTSAMQAVGAGIDVLIGQNQSLISTLTIQGQASLARQNVEAATLQQGLNLVSQRQKQLKDADAKLK